MRHQVPVLDDDPPEDDGMESTSSSSDGWNLVSGQSDPATPRTPETPGSSGLLRHGVIAANSGDEWHTVTPPIEPHLQQRTLNEQSFASTIVPSLQVPSDPPTAADWDVYRPLFTQLYVAENKTLNDTMQIMKDRYGFQAT